MSRNLTSPYEKYRPVDYGRHIGNQDKLIGIINRFMRKTGEKDPCYRNFILKKVNIIDDLLEVDWREYAYMVRYKELLEQAWEELGGSGICEHRCEDRPFKEVYTEGSVMPQYYPN